METDNFLNSKLNYNFPFNFVCNQLDHDIAFTLKVQYVDKSSIKYIKGDKFVHLKFHTCTQTCTKHYSFYVMFDLEDLEILSVDLKFRLINIIMKLRLNDSKNVNNFMAGINKDNLSKYEVNKTFASLKKVEKPQKRDSIQIKVNHLTKGIVQISLDPTKPNIKKTVLNLDSTNPSLKNNSYCNKKSALSRRQKKQIKKRRSFSESSCDDIKSAIDNEKKTAEKKNDVKNIKVITGRKCRSASESHTDRIPLKGILKNTSRYGTASTTTTATGSCSSYDETSCSTSADLTGSYESSNGAQSLSGSCKKTVRFNDVVQKQLFRMDSSILGQRKKNQKKRNQKQRAQQRRNSEGDVNDCSDDAEAPKSSISNQNDEQGNTDCKNSESDTSIDLNGSSPEENSSKASDSEFFDCDEHIFVIEM